MNSALLEASNFEGLKKALEKTPEEIIAIVKESSLKGRGGAGFPTGLKWEAALKAGGEGERFVLCNADEGEPGTFKDRLILTKAPLNVIEGILIACRVLDAKKAFIYLRGEYAHHRTALDRAIKKAKPYLGANGIDISVVLGEGAYICGDETAILNSIEGKRPEPRKKPPYPAEKGLYGKPTIVNNVETFAMVPLIFLGKFDSNKRLCSLSGDLHKAGVFEISEGKQAGTLLELAEPIGIPKALCFGASGGIIPFDPCMELTEANVKERGAFPGTWSVIVINHEHSIVELCRSIQAFFVHESCGYCAPCREGNLRMLELLEKISKGKGTKKDLQILRELSALLESSCFCALGRSAPLHVSTALRHFFWEFEEKCT
ncbi:MAG: NADH-quinone oxidoreductase subunit F [Candidatus Diapherotrites archaeon]|nr:NADH-quinone oxidoreductase subunit F [Candidatus Diapherotrites archaeon]